MRSRRGRRGRIWLPDPLSDHPLNTGLVGCWDGLTNDPFIGGSMARDIAPYRHHGTLVNGTTWEPGPYGGYGFGFDGTDDYVEISNSDAVKSSYPSTLAFWVQVRVYGASADGSIITKFDGTGGGAENKGIRTDAGDFFVTEQSTNRFNLSAWVTAGNWHHVVLTLSASKAAVAYVDGIQRATSTFVGTWFNGNDNPMRFGAPVSGFFNSGPTSFPGQIADVRIYNRALSAAEVSALYLQQQQGSPDLYNWVSSKMYSFANPNPYRYRRSQQIVGGGLI